MLRRFVPLMLCVVLALLVLVARLYEVAVEEHPIWAREAASLERSAHLVPYRRGRILDRNGTVWVRDQERFEVEFVWRDFRRGHPLGNITQLMSLTLMRPVDLNELAGGSAALWADHLVSLSPKEIREFGRGKELSVGGVKIEALSEDLTRNQRRQERRAPRAEDLRYYIERLLQVERKEWHTLRDLRDTKRASEPFVRLVAGLRQAQGESLNAASQRLRRELRQRVDESLLHLSELGNLVDWSQVESQPEEALLSPLERVVSVLDDAREESENLAADRLFRIAAGFAPGQLGKDNLSRLDLGWLQKCLYWDEGRLHAWRMQRGGRMDSEARRVGAGYVFARMQLAEGDAAHRVLDALAHEFALPSERPDPREDLVLPWERLGRLKVLAALPEALEEPLEAADLETPVLPMQTDALRGSGANGLELLHLSLQPYWQDLGGRIKAEAIAKALLKLPGERRRRTDWNPKELDPVEDVLGVWHAALDWRVAQILSSLPQPVAFHADALRAALEDRDHIIKDMSSRPMRFAREPSLEMVHHVERYHEDYAGLVVKSVRSRAPSLEALMPSGDPLEPDLMLAKHWIGKVRSPQLVSLLGRAAKERQAQELWRQVEMDATEQSFVKEAAAERYLPRQTIGGSGIEGYFDQELRGRNGFREVVGLQEIRGESARQPLSLLPQDGLDVQLTLDMGLQAAAEFVINHPEEPPVEELKVDPEWLEDPVGAIVLMQVDGRVLAAASAPLNAEKGGAHQDGEREKAIDRTLTMPRFVPPGSVLKPLVAAWAMEYLGLNPDAGRVICHPSTTNKKKSNAGYGAVGCHRGWGHSSPSNAEANRLDINLERAIRQSCNTYFAQMGEEMYGEGEFQKMFAAFGLGEPTGILQFGRQGRGGWLEDYGYRQIKKYAPVQRQRLGNGLTNITVTPMQMARAYAGLATGSCPMSKWWKASAVRRLFHKGKSYPSLPTTWM